ncbi:hypothetical protein [Mongoliitalea lutea]|uniref:Uncharacterized protein n=1 Tax=Mongoliitalea lutea TaxID=849756 RepID=A0A8J3G608_9BACT|nr:hypothetical protein [Mongoliitalea lutea]GHB41745.1 hypothetical protein GCM10008106_23410 [Mongoliitalea lutea]
MTNKELQKKAEELEQTLKMQLSIARNESGDYIKMGAVLLGSAMIAAATVKILGSKKKKKTEKVLQVLEKEGLLDEELQHRLTQKNQPGLMGRIGMALLPIAMNYGREFLIKRLNEQDSVAPSEDES